MKAPWLRQILAPCTNKHSKLVRTLITWEVTTIFPTWLKHQVPIHVPNNYRQRACKSRAFKCSQTPAIMTHSLHLKSVQTQVQINSLQAYLFTVVHLLAQLRRRWLLKRYLKLTAVKLSSLFRTIKWALRRQSQVHEQSKVPRKESWAVLALKMRLAHIGITMWQRTWWMESTTIPLSWDLSSRTALPKHHLLSAGSSQRIENWRCSDR